MLPQDIEFAVMAPYPQLYQAAFPTQTASSGLSRFFFSFVPYPRSETLGTTVIKIVKIFSLLPEALCSLVHGPSDALPHC